MKLISRSGVRSYDMDQTSAVRFACFALAAACLAAWGCATNPTVVCRGEATVERSDVAGWPVGWILGLGKAYRVETFEFNPNVTRRSLTVRGWNAKVDQLDIVCPAAFEPGVDFVATATYSVGDEVHTATMALIWSYARYDSHDQTLTLAMPFVPPVEPSQRPLTLEISIVPKSTPTSIYSMRAVLRGMYVPRDETSSIAGIDD